jgi:hypothetical protein
MAMRGANACATTHGERSPGATTSTPTAPAACARGSRVAGVVAPARGGVGSRPAARSGLDARRGGRAEHVGHRVAAQQRRRRDAKIAARRVRPARKTATRPRKRAGSSATVSPQRPANTAVARSNAAVPPYPAPAAADGTSGTQSVRTASGAPPTASRARAASKPMGP